MSRTYRRTKDVESWVTDIYDKTELWRYFSDAYVQTTWSRLLRKESNSKRRSHFKQEKSKFYKNCDYEVCLHKKYGNPWNWD